MITYINKDYAKAYTELFQNATQALIKSQLDNSDNLISDEIVMDFLREGEELDASGKIVDSEGNEIEASSNRSLKAKKGEEGYISLDNITSLEKYFYYLPHLVKIGDSPIEYNKLHSLGRRYTRLPLDEDNFIIDANARLIEVPAAFAKNGVGVQGDELCEVLYFEIDRYFDAMDLDTADIYIEWTRPDGQSGVSKPWVIDIEDKPNKIIFGWALSSTITKEVGALKFAVRFFKWSDGEHTKLTYSWATQVQTVTIKSTLDFTLGSDDYMAELDTDQTILGRIQNCHTYVTENGIALKPIFLFNLGDNIVTRVINGEEQEKEAGLPTDEVVFIDLVLDPSTNKETYPLKVQAYSPDAGTISYSWVKKDQEGTFLGTDADPTHSIVRSVFELTKDEEVDQNKVYYRKVEGNIYQPIVLNDEILASLSGDTLAEKGLYEKFSICEINQVGEYYAIATNRVTKKNSEQATSQRCSVPMPTQPIITTDITENETADYNIIPEVVNGESIDNGTVHLRVVANNDESNGSNKGTLSYTWWYKPRQEEEASFVRIKDATASELSIVNNVHFTGITEVEGGDPVEAEIPDLEGYYQVKINNHKNGEDTVVYSSICYVSYHAQAPRLSFPTGLEIPATGLADTQIEFGQEVHVEIDSTWAAIPNITDGGETGFTFAWYKSTDQIPSYNTEDELDPDKDQLISTAQRFVPSVQGNYYCVVTNHKNGTEASTVSKVFSVA